MSARRALLSLAMAAALSPPSTAAAPAPDGGLEYFSHVFPVAGAHGTRGPIGEFGAPRSGERTHEGFDIVAFCGAAVVAARGGRVRRVGFDPVLYGNFALVHGVGERRSYFYTHLRRPAVVREGEAVWTGERIGAVGDTGNARSIGCHLHFEVHVNGRPIDPEPLLRRWDRYS